MFNSFVHVVEEAFFEGAKKVMFAGSDFVGCVFSVYALQTAIRAVFFRESDNAVALYQHSKVSLYKKRGFNGQ